MDLKFSDVVEDIGTTSRTKTATREGGCVMTYGAGIRLLASQLPAITYSSACASIAGSTETKVMVNEKLHVFIQAFNAYACVGYASIHNSCHENQILEFPFILYAR